MSFLQTSSHLQCYGRLTFSLSAEVRDVSGTQPDFDFGSSVLRKAYFQPPAAEVRDVSVTQPDFDFGSSVLRKTKTAMVLRRKTAMVLRFTARERCWCDRRATVLPPPTPTPIFFADFFFAVRSLGVGRWGSGGEAVQD